MIDLMGRDVAFDWTVGVALFDCSVGGMRFHGLARVGGTSHGPVRCVQYGLAGLCLVAIPVVIK